MQHARGHYTVNNEFNRFTSHRWLCYNLHGFTEKNVSINDFEGVFAPFRVLFALNRVNHLTMPSIRAEDLSTQ